VPNYNTVDFKVTFNKMMIDSTTKYVQWNYDTTDFIDQADVDFVLCDINRTSKSNMPMNIYTTYTEDSASTSLETWSGVTSNNIGLFNGLALGDVDALATEAGTMDLCMMHAAPTTNALHAHSLSPCKLSANATRATAKPSTCLNNASPNCTDNSTYGDVWTGGRS